MNNRQRRQNDFTQEPGSSHWLNTIPLEDHNYTLNKQEFWDAIRLRYNWPIPNFPSRCACGMTFDVQHSMSCKKVGFVTHRYNNLRDITSKLLSEVCKDVEVEPLLTTLTGEAFQQRTAKWQDGAKLDVSANSFWIKGQKTFADIRVLIQMLRDTKTKRWSNVIWRTNWRKNANIMKETYKWNTVVFLH